MVHFFPSLSNQIYFYNRFPDECCIRQEKESPKMYFRTKNHCLPQRSIHCWSASLQLLDHGWADATWDSETQEGTVSLSVKQVRPFLLLVTEPWTPEESAPALLQWRPIYPTHLDTWYRLYTPPQQQLLHEASTNATHPTVSLSFEYRGLPN